MYKILRSIVLTPFVLMQASVVVFLLVHGRHEKAFRQAFYVFFITATIADCLFLVLGEVESDIAYVVGRDHEDGWINSGSSLADVVAGFLHVLRYIMLIAAVYQPLVHMIIAVNRLTTFAFPLRHSSIWSRRAVTLSTLGMMFVAVLFVGTPSVYLGVLFAVDPTEGSTPYGARLTWDDEAVVMTLLYRSLLLITCSVAAFLLNVVTVAMFILYRRSNKTGHAQRGQDVRLFVHSLFMLLVQAFLSLQTFSRTTNQLWMFTALEASVSWAPEWLKVDSREWFAGDPTCTGTSLGDTVAEMVGPVPGAQPCGTLYMILSGQQKLFGYADVEFMTNNLFSLCSGPFLLIVSGTVRSGYLQFYLKRWQRTKKNVVQATQVATVSSTTSISHLSGKQPRNGQALS
ncbi:hypothetical protein AAVH_30892 [Aphelenchoides avenae]|nr:hypothetical protein AAVH_30892 [Aphelenchus avenae]